MSEYEDEPAFVFSRSDGAIMKVYRSKTDRFVSIVKIDDAPMDWTSYYQRQMERGLIKKK